MQRTSLKYFDYATLKVMNLYTDKEGYLYIRRGNKYEHADYQGEVFDPKNAPKFNRTNLIRYLRKWIKIHKDNADKTRRDHAYFYRDLGGAEALADALEYVLKMQEG